MNLNYLGYGLLINVFNFGNKLDYIKDLGVDAIWFSPLYPSPNADYGYDIADYRDISPDYGTLEEFKALIKKYNLEISALSCHGNPVHPNKELAAEFDKAMRDAVLMAEKYGIQLSVHMPYFINLATEDEEKKIKKVLLKKK